MRGPAWPARPSRWARCSARTDGISAEGIRLCVVSCPSRVEPGMMMASCFSIEPMGLDCGRFGLRQQLHAPYFLQPRRSRRPQ
jgi:hypothetical protein